MLDLTYQDALNWLYSFADSEKRLPTAPVEFNLLRTESLSQGLGLLPTPYPSVVIAGTKGKGSTAAMLEAILRSAGYRTGLYTSPSLHSIRERIQLDRCLISKHQFTELLVQMRPIVDRLDPNLGPPSIYELMTVLALLCFAQSRVDVAVLEIGLGGRLDSVNVVTPVVSVITSISFDHQAILGNTLDAIATEKAGIIKPGVPIITLPQSSEIMDAIARIAHQQDANLILATPSGVQYADQQTLRPYPVAIAANTVNLPGAFQLDNARLAVATSMALPATGMSIPVSAIQTGLATITWPGRLEVLQTQPWVIADAAHNGDSAAKLAKALPDHWDFQRLLLVLGTSADKDLAAIAQALIPQFAIVILTRSTHPRSAPVEQLQTAVQPFLNGECYICDSVASALETALQLASPQDLICVTGSVFVAAAAREWFGKGERD